MKIKHQLTLAYAAVIMAFSPSIYAIQAMQLKEKNTLSICSYAEFKPISYGNGQGYEADLLRAVAYTKQMKIKFYPEKIYEGIWLLPVKNNAQCDIAAGGITPTDERKQQGATFTTSTMSFDQSLLVRRADYQSGRITSYDSFKESQMKIGVVPGTTGEKYAIERAKAANLPTSVFVQYESESQLLPALIKGHIDAIARGEIGNEYQASLDKHLITIAKKSFNEGFTFSVDGSKNQVLLNDLNQAIRLLTDNGKITYKAWVKNPHVFMERAEQLRQ